MENINTNLSEISGLSLEREIENESFKTFLLDQDGFEMDKEVQGLNAAISPMIDCTQCGNCCKSLMINVSEKETEQLAAYLQTSTTTVIKEFLEVSSNGKMVINQIPCHFLKENKCSIYDNRFSGCREFPHLHQTGFTGRLFSIFMYYPICPIIFNVVEALKTRTGFGN